MLRGARLVAALLSALSSVLLCCSVDGVIWSAVLQRSRCTSNNVSSASSCTRQRSTAARFIEALPRLGLGKAEQPARSPRLRTTLSASVCDPSDPAVKLTKPSAGKNPQAATAELDSQRLKAFETVYICRIEA